MTVDGHMSDNFLPIHAISFRQIKKIHKFFLSFPSFTSVLEKPHESMAKRVQIKDQ